MGVPIVFGSLEIRRRVSIRTKPGMRLPLQVQVDMKGPVVQFRRCGIGTRLFVVASSARRNADGASPLTVFAFFSRRLRALGKRGMGDR